MTFYYIILGSQALCIIHISAIIKPVTETEIKHVYDRQ